MHFIATEQQLKQIIFNAIDASNPFGNGHYEYCPELGVKPEDLKLNEEYLIFDYVRGRCVKLFIYKVGENCYEIEDEPIVDRQTWMGRYSTNEALIKSVDGTKIVQQIDLQTLTR
ncbi:hypothetical protein [Microcoleus sp. herbarium2]|uniref:hypothetical protein n=1 Tax=Microcoleus sp. herbarium2 TaxID=3055433 RepID=UPI002FD5D51A